MIGEKQDKDELLFRAQLLHRRMLTMGPEYALPRLGLALDLATLTMHRWKNNTVDIKTKRESLERVTRFVLNNPVQSGSST